MKNNLKQDQCSVYERKGQLVFALNCEKEIPYEAPVRLVSAVLEELDYKKGTLKPFLRRIERYQQARYEEVVADAGYGEPG